MWLVKLVLLFATAYVVVVAVIYTAQSWLLFPTWLAAPLDLPLPATISSLAVETPDGTRLQGVRIPPSRPGDENRLVVLGFGGNAWNAQSLAAYLHDLFPDAEIVAFHYRGYRPSTGRPSAAALLADAPIVYDHVLQTVGQGRVVAVGISVGAGVAAYLANRRALSGLILVTPFDSLEALAREHYPWLPIGWLLRHHMPTADFVRGLPIPIALITAERDRIVPARRTMAVRRAIAHPVLDRAITGADHNSLYRYPAFREAVVEALARIVEAPNGRSDLLNARQEETYGLR